MSNINRRDFMKSGISATAATAASLTIPTGNNSAQAQVNNGRKPNFVILFADDMGYGDWQRGGHPTIRTPNLNRMADQGVQMTQFYSGNPVCSHSRLACVPFPAPGAPSRMRFVDIRSLSGLTAPSHSPGA